MKTGADIYAELEGIWISNPDYLSRRFPLEDKIAELSEDQLRVTQLWIQFAINTRFIKDKKAAKSIWKIIHETLNGIEKEVNLDDYMKQLVMTA